jgi:putative transposase
LSTFYLLLYLLYLILPCFVYGIQPLTPTLAHICLAVARFFQHSQRHVLAWTKPAKPTTNSLVLGTLADLSKSKSALVMENAMLRQQLIVLSRQINRPQLTKIDRTLFVLLASKLHTWKSTLLIVQPDTLLRWHRQGFRLFWKRKSKAKSLEPRIPTETVELIKQIAKENRLWGAERIQGELLKLDIRVCKRTIQKYMRQARRPRPSERKTSQNWSTFLHNHASQIWACDFLPVYDLLFRPLFIFFIIELSSRRVVHFGVTQSPTDSWVAQQLREATPHGQVPKYLIRDNDSKFGERFTRVAAGSSIEMLRTPYKAPRANAVCERFLGSVRRECLDHILILSERHLHRVIKEYVQYFNMARPHQGIRQTIPVPQVVKLGESQLGETSLPPPEGIGKVISLPVLGGLHHDYRIAA